MQYDSRRAGEFVANRGENAEQVAEIAGALGVFDSAVKTLRDVTTQKLENLKLFHRAAQEDNDADTYIKSRLVEVIEKSLKKLQVKELASDGQDAISEAEAAINHALNGLSTTVFAPDQIEQQLTDIANQCQEARDALLDNPRGYAGILEDLKSLAESSILSDPHAKEQLVSDIRSAFREISEAISMVKGVWKSYDDRESAALNQVKLAGIAKN